MATIDEAIQAAELIEDRIGKGAEAAQKAHEATRVLREAISDAESTRKALAAQEARIAAMTEEAIKGRIEKAVSEQLEVLGKITEESMRKSVAKVTAEFDKLQAILLGEDEGKKSIKKMVDDIEAAFQLKWPVFLNAMAAAQATLRGCSDENCKKPAKWAVLAMLEIPDKENPAETFRGEGHFHLCLQHKELMKSDPKVTILKSFELETKMCPYHHDIVYYHESPET